MNDILRIHLLQIAVSKKQASKVSNYTQTTFVAIMVDQIFLYLGLRLNAYPKLYLTGMYLHAIFCASPTLFSWVAIDRFCFA